MLKSMKCLYFVRPKIPFIDRIDIFLQYKYYLKTKQAMEPVYLSSNYNLLVIDTESYRAIYLVFLARIPFQLV